MAQNDIEIIARFAADLVSGRQFSRSAISWASVLHSSDWVILNRRTFSRVAVAVATFAAQSDEANMLAGRILTALSKSQYQTKHELAATMYRAAGEAVAAQYEDIVGRAGPEGPQFRGKRPYHLGTVATLMDTLATAIEPGRGRGWCLAYIIAHPGFATDIAAAPIG